MKATDYAASLSFDASLLEPTPAERERQDKIREGALAMGRALRLSQRRMARECGMTKLPAAVIYMGTRGYVEPFVLPEEDLTVLLPEEVDCAGGCK